MATLESGDTVTADWVDTLTQSAKVALTASDVAGGLLSWVNPESAHINILRIQIRLDTATSGACTADYGVVAGASTSGDNLIDGLDMNQTGLFDNIDDQGTNGSSSRPMGPSAYITGSVASGASAGLSGAAYIYYRLA